MMDFVGPDLTGPLPLPDRYNLDLESVPWAPPGAASFAELEALCMKWRQRKLNRLHCHPIVEYQLKMTAPVPEYPPREYDSLFGIELIVDATMPRGAWELLEGDELIDSGTITDDRTAP